MKRLVSILLGLIMLLSITTVRVFAETTDSKYLYKDKFVEYELQEYMQMPLYEELYYHRDNSDEIDWALIRAWVYPAGDMQVGLVFCDMYIETNSYFVPFYVDYGIYDAKKDKFCSFLSIEANDYEGLYEVVKEKVDGRHVGDADSDGELTVMDATFIQRALAQLCEFSPRDALECSSLKYLSDFDGDGDVSIMDATAIQRRLARLDVPVATPDEI